LRAHEESLSIIGAVDISNGSIWVFDIEPSITIEVNGFSLEWSTEISAAAIIVETEEVAI
jgi:hypothetical protein